MLCFFPKWRYSPLIQSTLCKVGAKCKLRSQAYQPTLTRGVKNVRKRLNDFSCFPGPNLVRSNLIPTRSIFARLAYWCNNFITSTVPKRFQRQRSFSLILSTARRSRYQAHEVCAPTEHNLCSLQAQNFPLRALGSLTPISTLSPFVRKPRDANTETNRRSLPSGNQQLGEAGFVVRTRQFDTVQCDWLKAYSLVNNNKIVCTSSHRRRKWVGGYWE